MNSKDAAVVKALLDKPQNIIIIPHKNPDGDAMGSCLGLQLFLKSKSIESTVVAPNDYPKFLKWLPGSDQVVNFEQQNSTAKNKITAASLIFTLDFNDLSRTGQMSDHLEASEADFIMIDHHQAPSNYAKVTYSDVRMSSTCEMVYTFIEAMNGVENITPEIASCLYTGIMTDTGSFRFAATTSQTHRVAAELIDKGANHDLIHRKVFDANSPSRLHLLGTALKNMVILEDYRTAYITLSQDELDAHDFKKGDTEGFVNYGLTLENIIFAVIFIENREEGIIKISFRSVGNFSVNEFARTHFDGGGHTNAAGGRSEMDMKATLEKFESLLKRYKTQLTE